MTDVLNFPYREEFLLRRKGNGLPRRHNFGTHARTFWTLESIWLENAYWIDENYCVALYNIIEEKFCIIYLTIFSETNNVKKNLLYGKFYNVCSRGAIMLLRNDVVHVLRPYNNSSTFKIFLTAICEFNNHQHDANIFVYTFERCNETIPQHS
jgi:hypothetical protein